MKAERLHNLLHDLVDDLDEDEISAKLKNFRNLFHQSLTQITADTAAAFTNYRDEFWEVLNKSSSNDLAPSAQLMLAEIGGAPYFGNGLIESLQGIIADNTVPPGEVVTKLDEHINNANARWAAMRAAKESLGGLDVSLDYTDRDQYEFGMRLPSEMFDNNIDELSQELRDLHLSLKVLAVQRKVTFQARPDLVEVDS